jgi:hypothetical protein
MVKDENDSKEIIIEDEENILIDKKSLMMKIKGKISISIFMKRKKI